MGGEHFVLRARGRKHHVRDFAGPLSIKTVIDGRVGWKTGGQEVLVDVHPKRREYQVDLGDFLQPDRVRTRPADLIRDRCRAGREVGLAQGLDGLDQGGLGIARTGERRDNCVHVGADIQVAGDHTHLAGSALELFGGQGLTAWFRGRVGAPHRQQHSAKETERTSGSHRDLQVSGRRCVPLYVTAGTSRESQA